MKDLMIDLETLGTETEAVVLSIGAVFFDDEKLGQSYYCELDPEEQRLKDRSWSWSTIQWWGTQPKSDHHPFHNPKFGDEVGPALRRFVIWLKSVGGEDVRVWGNGPNFDVGILESLFMTYEIKVPWKFRNIRDLRTFQEHVANNEPVPRSEYHHKAIADAKEQALYVIKHRKNK